MPRVQEVRLQPTHDIQDVQAALAELERRINELIRQWNDTQPET